MSAKQKITRADIMAMEEYRARRAALKWPKLKLLLKQSFAQQSFHGVARGRWEKSERRSKGSLNGALQVFRLCVQVRRHAN